PPLLDQTIGQHFASIVSQFGDHTAVVSRHQQIRLTYDDLDGKSNALSRGLQGVGVKRGDRVAHYGERWSKSESIPYTGRTSIWLVNEVSMLPLEVSDIIQSAAGVVVPEDSIKELGSTNPGCWFRPDLVMLGDGDQKLFLTSRQVPLNPAFNSAQVIAALNHLGASHLIIGAETNIPRKPPRSNAPLLQQIIPDLQGHKLQSESIPSLQQIILVENSNGRIETANFKPLLNYKDLLNGNPSTSNPNPSLSPNDIVNIQFTSGTTSLPKAACLTHRSILNNGKSIGDRMLLTPSDIICCPPPLFHCFGCILGYMATATHASSIVFPSEAFDPIATLRSVQEEKCTALYGVPTMFLAELELLSNGTVPYEGFQHLRTGIAAGSSIPAELMRRLHKVLNLTELTICYGMTETSPVSAMTTTDDPLEMRVDSVGRLLPHVEAKVVDPVDRNRILPIGERGELAVSGYLVMKEYWGDPEKTAEVMLKDEEGKVWMHVGFFFSFVKTVSITTDGLDGRMYPNSEISIQTGDEALLSPQGYLKITGRIKDLIIRGGENIHPLEIENCLLAHPIVKDASVVGLSDDRYGEVVTAFVVRNAGVAGSGKDGEDEGAGKDKMEQEIRSWVKEKLSHHLGELYSSLW
ncbi:MAG: hypothetical protein Q9192_008026, partial [Flavoplaca navasiana]